MSTAASQVVYRSNVRTEWAKEGARKTASAGQYHVTSREPRAAALDAIVAAAADDLTSTFGAALQARQIDASGGKLMSETVGEIELEDNVLVIRRIHTRFKLKVSESDREGAMRVHRFFADQSPVYRTLKSAIAVTTELSIEPEPEDLILGDQGQKGG